MCWWKNPCTVPSLGRSWEATKHTPIPRALWLQMLKYKNSVSMDEELQWLAM